MQVFDFNCIRIAYIALFIYSRSTFVRTNERYSEGEEHEYVANNIQYDTEMPGFISDESYDVSALNMTRTQEPNETKEHVSYQKKYEEELFTFTEKIYDSRELIRLRKSLLFGYDRFSRPLVNSSHQVVVKLGVNVAQINGLDEDYQVRFAFDAYKINKNTIIFWYELKGDGEYFTNKSPLE
jgi:hypothetical protein